MYRKGGDLVGTVGAQIGVSDLGKTGRAENDGPLQVVARAGSGAACTASMTRV